MNGRASAAQGASLSIRRAELRDVHDIKRIDGESFPAPWSEKLTITQVTGTGRVHFVAEYNFEVVGHGGLVFQANEAHVATIAVAESARRQGIGDAIVVRLLEAAEANSCAGLTLEVRSSNVAAIKLYERHGLEAVGVRKGYYQNDGEDAVIMTSSSS